MADEPDRQLTSEQLAKLLADSYKTIYKNRVTFDLPLPFTLPGEEALVEVQATFYTDDNLDEDTVAKIARTALQNENLILANVSTTPMRYRPEHYFK